MSRALVLALALIVSPLGAAVCEVVCGLPSITASAVPAALEEHAHHGHHAAPAPEAVIVRTSSPDDVSISIPAPDCDLRAAVPARLRSSAVDVIASSAAITTIVYRLDDAQARPSFAYGAATSPPAPPPLTPAPLRI